MLHNLANGANSISTLIAKNASVQSLQHSLKSPFLTQFLSPSISIDSLNFDELLSEFQGSKPMLSTVNTTFELMQCIRKNRFVGIDTEEELEEIATRLTKHREFIAGLVFLGDDGQGLKDIGEKVRYKIRMDQDNVPTTLALKDLYWSPGPQGNFLEDLRYFRGFVQLQDMVEQGIIGLHSDNSKNESDYEILTQQLPYPCWKQDT